VCLVLVCMCIHHRIIQYLKLEGTHKDHQVQLPKYVTYISITVMISDFIMVCIIAFIFYKRDLNEWKGRVLAGCIF